MRQRLALLTEHVANVLVTPADSCELLLLDMVKLLATSRSKSKIVQYHVSKAKSVVLNGFKAFKLLGGAPYVMLNAVCCDSLCLFFII